jgi:hypothetical protein
VEGAMNTITHDLELARQDIGMSSAGGSPFLISYGLTFLTTAVVSLFLDVRIVALIAMFQGGVALPLALWLERRLGRKRMSSNNPLKPLSAQLAMSQALGLPALIAVYSLDPKLVPLALASLGGVHFVPYAWLHNTRTYIYLAVAISVGAFAIQVTLRTHDLEAILFWIAAVYLVAAGSILRRYRAGVSSGNL